MVSREQARHQGLTDAGIHRLIRAGAWHRIDTGVFSLNSAPASWERQLQAAVLSRPKELPEYSRQVPFSFEQMKATVDAHIPEWKLIVEADGRRWHTRQADFERDRERDNAAASAGLVAVRFTYRMLTKERDSCLKTLLEAGRWRG